MVNTNAEGRAQAVLYAGYPSGRNEWGHVGATDDLNTPLPTSNDPYGESRLYDWERLKIEGVYYLITIDAYGHSGGKSGAGDQAL